MEDMKQQTSSSDNYNQISREFKKNQQRSIRNQFLLRRIDLQNRHNETTFQQKSLINQSDSLIQETELQKDILPGLDEDPSLEEILQMLSNQNNQSDQNYQELKKAQYQKQVHGDYSKQYLLEAIQKNDLVTQYKQFKGKIYNFIKIFNNNKLQNVENAVCFIGTSGSGKTALRMYLQNFKKNQSDFVNFKKARSKFQIKHLFDQQKYEINHYYKSESNSFPMYQFQQKFHIQLLGLLAPCTSNQELFNCIQNSTVLTKILSIKIVIVIELSFITIAKGSVFVTFINQICNIFKQNFENVMRSMLFVFSKVKVQNNYEQLIEQITQDLNQIVLRNENLSLQGKILISNSIQDKRISVFPTPDTSQINDILQIIRKKLFKTNFGSLDKKQKINLSQKAISVANSYIPLFNLQIESNLQKFIKFINDYYDHISHEFKDIQEQLKKIENLQPQLNKCKDFKTFLNILKQHYGCQFDFQQQINKFFQVCQFFSNLAQKQNFYQFFIKQILQKIIIKKLTLLKEQEKQYDKIKKEQFMDSLKLNEQLLQQSFNLQISRISQKLFKKEKELKQQIQLKQKQLQIRKVEKNIQNEKIEKIRLQMSRQIKSIKQNNNSSYTCIHHIYDDGAGCQIM